MQVCIIRLPFQSERPPGKVCLIKYYIPGKLSSQEKTRYTLTENFGSSTAP